MSYRLISQQRPRILKILLRPRETSVCQRAMDEISQSVSRACQFAAAVVAWEVEKRRRLNPHFNPDEVWASVRLDARICVGTPLLHPGEGYYVNHCGDLRKA